MNFLQTYFPNAYYYVYAPEDQEIKQWRHCTTLDELFTYFRSYSQDPSSKHSLHFLFGRNEKTARFVKDFFDEKEKDFNPSHIPDLRNLMKALLPVTPEKSVSSENFFLLERINNLVVKLLIDCKTPEELLTCLSTLKTKKKLIQNEEAIDFLTVFFSNEKQFDRSHTLALRNFVHILTENLPQKNDQNSSLHHKVEILRNKVDTLATTLLIDQLPREVWEIIAAYDLPSVGRLVEMEELIEKEILQNIEEKATLCMKIRPLTRSEVLEVGNWFRQLTDEDKHLFLLYIDSLVLPLKESSDHLKNSYGIPLIVPKLNQIFYALFNDEHIQTLNLSYCPHLAERLIERFMFSPLKYLNLVGCNLPLDSIKKHFNYLEVLDLSERAVAFNRPKSFFSEDTERNVFNEQIDNIFNPKRFPKLKRLNLQNNPHLSKDTIIRIQRNLQDLPGLVIMHDYQNLENEEKS